MTDDERLQLAEELLASFNAHQVERIGRLLSDTILVVSPQGPVGPYGWKAQTAAYFKGFPDSAWSKTGLSAEGDRFLLDVMWTATQVDPPTGRMLCLPVKLVGQVKHHKIETLRLEYDAALLRSQIEEPRSGSAAARVPPARKE